MSFFHRDGHTNTHGQADSNGVPNSVSTSGTNTFSSTNVPGMNKASGATSVPGMDTAFGTSKRSSSRVQHTGSPLDMDVSPLATSVPGASAVSNMSAATDENARTAGMPSMPGRSGFGRDTSMDVNAVPSGFRRHDEVNVYADQMREQHGMDKRKRALIVLILVLIVLIPLVIILPYGLFEQRIVISIGSLNHMVMSNVHDLIAMFADPGSSGSEVGIVSRYLCVAIAGAAFGLTGAVYQGALKNDLASPTTLGVDQGATLGMTVFVLLLQGTMISVSHLPISDIAYMMGDLTFINWVWMMYGRMICALLGSFAAVAVVLLIARVAGHGHTSSLWIIVAGSILATALSSVSSLIDIYFETTGSIAQEELATVVSAKSFTQIHSFVDVGLLVVPVGICLFILIAMRSKLGVLSFGEDEARSMGVDPHRTSNIMIGVTTFMSAVVISICGNVAFLGFIVPHITRRWIGADFRYLVPASALCGSIVLLVSYYASSVISQEASSYVSMFMSLIGFAAFIFMFFGKQGWGRHAGE